MGLWDRLTGKVVDAAGLGQKKRAVTTGIAAFADPVSDLRLEIAIKSHPWLQNSATTGLLLSIWAAQTLQDMAAILEATAQRRLGDTGKLPEATFALADDLYDSALRWIESGQKALGAIDADPDFVLPVQLPARAPRFEWVPDAPAAHFAAAIQAATQLGTAVEDALNTAQADRSRLPGRYDPAFALITGAMRVARAKLDQVEAAESDRQAVKLEQDIWAMLPEVVGLYFTAGQQIARPSIIDPKYDAVAQAAARSRRLPPPPSQAPPPPQARRDSPPRSTPAQAAGPGRPAVRVGPGQAPRTAVQPVPEPAPPPPPPTLSQRLGLSFDAWSLTDPGTKATYLNDPVRNAELEAFWRTDTNPAETYRLFSLITVAVKAGQVAARPGEFTRVCPWTPVFVALADVIIGSEQFKKGQIFSFKVGVEGDYFGRGFDRLGFVPGTQQPRPRPPGPTSDDGAPGTSRIDTQRHADRGPHPVRPAAPAGPAEDIWRLTAAFQRPQRRASQADTDKLRELWRADPDPVRTTAFYEELMAAVRAGAVRQNGDEALRDCPWSQVYVALSQITIGGVRLERNEKFALQAEVSQGTFRRVICRLGAIKTG